MHKNNEHVTCVQTLFPCEMFLQLRVLDLLRTAALRQDDALRFQLDQINFGSCDVLDIFLTAHDREKLIFWSFQAFS